MDYACHFNPFNNVPRSLCSNFGVDKVKITLCRSVEGLHGSEELYASGYDDQALVVWAHRVVTWATGGEVTDGRKASGTRAVKRRNRDVFVYFDNDRKVKAPFDAAALRERVSQSLDIKRAG